MRRNAPIQLSRQGRRIGQKFFHFWHWISLLQPSIARIRFGLLAKLANCAKLDQYFVICTPESWLIGCLEKKNVRNREVSAIFEKTGNVRMKGWTACTIGITFMSRSYYYIICMEFPGCCKLSRNWRRGNIDPKIVLIIDLNREIHYIYRKKFQHILKKSFFNKCWLFCAFVGSVVFYRSLYSWRTNGQISHLFMQFCIIRRQTFASGIYFNSFFTGQFSK